MNQDNYKFHLISTIFPEMSEQEFRELKKDIKDNGLIEPIWLYDGQIIDGRNRYKACSELDIKPIFTEYDGSGSLPAFVVSLNLKRRHLNESQKAFVALKLEAIYAEEAKERQGTRTDIAEIFPQSEMGRARDKAAAAVQTNPHYVTDAKKIQEKAPQLAEEINAGRLTIPKAIKEIKRKEVKAHLESMDTQSIKAISGVYDVIVVDPPWPMRKIERDVAPNQVEFDYPTMSLEEIGALKIPAADDCHLFLWTTQKFLPDAFDVLATWGFKYTCVFTWHKPGGFQVVGLPQFNCEFALYARKGTPEFIDTKDFRTCFEAPRTGHSVKPSEFYEMVRRVTAGRRIDMFSRRKIEGFDSWGNEAPSDTFSSDSSNSNAA